MISISEYNQYIAPLLANALQNQPANTTFIAELKSLSEKYVDNSSETYLNEEDASSIKDIFIRRANIAKGKHCYTSQHPEALEINNPWISFAQQLCSEGGLFEHHYYYLLFPEATNIDDIDYIQTSSFSAQPLRQLYYSAGEKRLLSLESGYACAKANHGRMGFFVYSTKDDGTNKSYWYELNKTELGLLNQTNQYYFDLLHELQTLPENSDSGKDLSYITVQLLAIMVDCSYFASGDSKKYTEDEFKQAYAAYCAFYTLYSTTLLDGSIITGQEKANLKGQIIHHDGRGLLFDHLWIEVVKGALCVAWASKDMATLVWDYLPNHQFSNLVSNQDSLRAAKKSLIENKSPFSSKQQTLAFAFVIMDMLLKDQANSPALDKLYTQSLLPLAKLIKIPQITHEECALAVKSALEIFFDRITHIARSIRGEKTDSAPYIKEKKFEILTEASNLTLERAEAIIKKKLEECVSSALKLDRHPGLTFTYKLFSSINEKMAIGLLVLASLAESGEPEVILKEHRISLFRSFNLLNTTEIEEIVRNIINLFASKQYSSLKINQLAAKMAVLNQFEAVNTILKTGFDQILACLCDANNTSSAFFVSFGRAPNRLAVDAITLTELYKRDRTITDSLPQSILRDIFQFVQEQNYVFSPESLSRTESLVVDHCVYDVGDKNNNNFDP